MKTTLLPSNVFKMSDEEVTVETSDGQILAAEYKDGQLQIVEVTPFDKDREGGLIPLTDGGDQQTKYMQVLDTSKGLVQLDLLNLTLVRCPDGEDGYQFVANTGSAGELSSDGTVTCVLQSSDTEDPDNHESYVMVDSQNGQAPLVFLKSSLQEAAASMSSGEIKEENSVNKHLSPTEILEKAKTLQKAKAMLSSPPRGRGRGRKRKSDLPPPHELLASPNFKLYLYSCKMCSFKCNAVKEMSAHKATEHSGAGRAGRAGGARGSAVTLQCARCPFRGAVHSQLMKHVQDKHLTAQVTNTVHLDTEEVENADVLVCGACGFESGSRSVFRKHIEEDHGATTC
ncbi:unnamed protein product [Arctia plantaginis]|uniref:C2H2-type domain-containing protein n=1 Tax=Arctia plantaginis TaxID=874455 RepID=A0A8S0ZT75_ARCPL|nr:unnamed protein product [Arctia plantaginis]